MASTNADPRPADTSSTRITGASGLQAQNARITSRPVSWRSAAVVIMTNVHGPASRGKGYFQ
jgi:hypothetical protein